MRLRSILDYTMALASLFTLTLNFIGGQWMFVSVGALLLVSWIGWRASKQREHANDQSASAPTPSPARPLPTTSIAVEDKDPLDRVEIGDDTCDLIEELLAEGRYALLLRPQLVDNLTEGQLVRALTQLDDQMAMIAAGDVTTRYWNALEQEREPDDRKSAVDSYFLDRYPITNKQYHRFLEAGAYEQQSLWDSGIWPCVEQFVDQSGEPGPRFWNDGNFPLGEEKHPVVGINWYEARAYANWIGKRLPGDAEWVKAATWPVQTGARTIQRRFPWGDAMDPRCVQLWSHEVTGPTRVDAHPAGASPDAVHQLIGNVWEWMHGDFGLADEEADRISFPTPMKSIRGGAFDTYFEAQASAQFQSGEEVLARKHNVGFRCAVAVSDLALSTQHSADDATNGDEVAQPEETAV